MYKCADNGASEAPGNFGGSGHAYLRYRDDTAPARRPTELLEGLNAYERRALMPMRARRGQVKLWHPFPHEVLDASDLAPSQCPAFPLFPRRSMVRSATWSKGLRWPAPAGRVTIVPCPSPHAPRPRRRRVSR